MPMLCMHCLIDQIANNLVSSLYILLRSLGLMQAWCQPAEFVDSKSSDVSYLIFFALQFRFPSVLLLVHVCGFRRDLHYDLLDWNRGWKSWKTSNPEACLPGGWVKRGTQRIKHVVTRKKPTTFAKRPAFFLRFGDRPKKKKTQPAGPWCQRRCDLGVQNSKGMEGPWEAIRSKKLCTSDSCWDPQDGEKLKPQFDMCPQEKWFRSEVIQFLWRSLYLGLQQITPLQYVWVTLSVNRNEDKERRGDGIENHRIQTRYTCHMYLTWPSMAILDFIWAQLRWSLQSVVASPHWSTYESGMAFRSSVITIESTSYFDWNANDWKQFWMGFLESPPKERVMCHVWVMPCGFPFLATNLWALVAAFCLRMTFIWRSPDIRNREYAAGCP